MSLYHLVVAERDPIAPARASIIWLHGLGAPWDFVDFAPELRLREDLAVRWIFPQAPTIPVTINARHPMPAWYDILGMEPGTPHDAKGIVANAKGIERLIEREAARGVPPERVILGGFSQGGALSLYTGLRHRSRLGGIVALSAYGLLAETFAAEASAAGKATPIFQAHGKHDPMVPFARGRDCAMALKSLGYQIEWREYPMEHTVHPDEVKDIREFLQTALAAMDLK